MKNGNHFDVFHRFIDVLLVITRLLESKIKSGLTVTKSHLAQLRYFREWHLSLNSIDTYLVYAGDNQYVWDGVNVIGWASIPDFFRKVQLS